VPRRRATATAAPTRRRTQPVDLDDDDGDLEDEDDLGDDEEDEDEAPPSRRSKNAPDPDELLSSGAPAVKFKKINDIVKGVVLKKETVQQRDFDTGQLKTWDDGNPAWQVVFTLQTQYHDDDKDDGERRLFAKSPGGILSAIRAAQKAAGAKTIEIGGTLIVKYVSDGTPPRRNLQPPKEFVAKYIPPAAPARRR
jgi:hypothetical protein